MANETPEDSAAAGEAASDANQAAQYAPEQLGDADAAGQQVAADVNLDLVLDVPVTVSLRVGSTDISIRDLVRLVEGSVVALDRESEEPMDVLVNGTLVAHGEIVVVDDKYGVRLTDVIGPAERIEKLN